MQPTTTNPKLVPIHYRGLSEVPSESLSECSDHYTYWMGFPIDTDVLSPLPMTVINCEIKALYDAYTTGGYSNWDPSKNAS